MKFKLFFLAMVAGMSAFAQGLKENQTLAERYNEARDSFISTDPLNKSYGDGTHTMGENAFDWRTRYYKLFNEFTGDVEYVLSPFYNMTRDEFSFSGNKKVVNDLRPRVSLPEGDQVPDFMSEDGWELVKVDFGMDKYNHKAKLPLTFPMPYLVLYNRKTGILRTFVYHRAYQKLWDFNFLKVEMTFEGSSQPTSVLTGLGTAGFKEDNKLNSKLTALCPVFLNKNFTFCDFSMSYDPTTIAKDAQIKLSITPSQYGDLKLQGMMQGTSQNVRDIKDINRHLLHSFLSTDNKYRIGAMTMMNFDKYYNEYKNDQDIGTISLGGSGDPIKDVTKFVSSSFGFGTLFKKLPTKAFGYANKTLGLAADTYGLGKTLLGGGGVATIQFPRPIPHFISGEIALKGQSIEASPTMSTTFRLPGSREYNGQLTVYNEVLGVIGAKNFHARHYWKFFGHEFLAFNDVTYYINPAAGLINPKVTFDVRFQNKDWQNPVNPQFADTGQTIPHERVREGRILTTTLKGLTQEDFRRVIKINFVNRETIDAIRKSGGSGSQVFNFEYHRSLTLQNITIIAKVECDNADTQEFVFYGKHFSTGIPQRRDSNGNIIKHYPFEGHIGQTFDDLVAMREIEKSKAAVDINQEITLPSNYSEITSTISKHNENVKEEQPLKPQQTINEMVQSVLKRRVGNFITVSSDQLWDGLQSEEALADFLASMKKKGFTLISCYGNDLPTFIFYTPFEETWSTKPGHILCDSSSVHFGHGQLSKENGRITGFEKGWSNSTWIDSKLSTGKYKIRIKYSALADSKFSLVTHSSYYEWKETSLNLEGTGSLENLVTHSYEKEFELEIYDGRVHLLCDPNTHIVLEKIEFIRVQ